MYSIVFVCVCMYMQCKWSLHDNRRPDPGTPTVSDSVSVAEEAVGDGLPGCRLS